MKEQAAQRDELLARTADEVSRAAEAASGDARQKDLTDANRASREAGARIAAENLRRAIAARVAAANRRQAVQNGPDDHEAASGSDLENTDSSSGGSTGGSGSGGGSGNSTGGVSPVPGAVIGSHFGEYGSWSRYHTGIDFRAGHGTPIRAVKSGVVLYAGNSGELGWQPCRHQARGWQDHHVLAHVLHGRQSWPDCAGWTDHRSRRPDRPRLRRSPPLRALSRGYQVRRRVQGNQSATMASGQRSHDALS